MEPTQKQDNPGVLIFFIIWAVALLGGFLYFRGDDLGRLGVFLGNIGSQGFFGFSGFAESVSGIVIAFLIFASWYGLGSFKAGYIEKIFGTSVNDDLRHPALEFARNIAIGAATWSFIWFFLGLFGLYTKGAAAFSIVLGLALAVHGLLKWKRASADGDPLGFPGKAALGLTITLCLLALLSAIAPPAAKDTLLYHFAVPKAFIAAGNNAVIEGNIASYLALATEMHTTWAMLAGQFFSARVGEAAAGAVVSSFAALLILAIFGWSRELGLSKMWAAIAALLVASIPTFYHVAASGYIDLALALYVALAIDAIAKWWKGGEKNWIAYLAIFLGAALSIKLTALFAFAALGLVFLLRMREEQNDGKPEIGKIAASAAKAFGGALLFASPWYLRDWKASGSPIFPFYMNLWPGAAPGWDAERSALFQIINSKYGGDSKGILDYLLSPLWLSIKAQPELPEFFDGVLGIAFIFGLPLVVWALKKGWLKKEINLGLIVAAVLFFCWLFTSQQLRYLLPVFPVLAIALCHACYSLAKENKALEKGLAFILLAIAAVSGSVSFAWFARKNPVGAFFGGETRDSYLARNIDYYPYYQVVNNDLPPDSKVWLINMRRDSYLIERPYFSDYMFEDWTLKKLSEESRNLAELQAKAKAMGITHILARHDFLLDYKRSVLVDDKRDEKLNREKLDMAKALMLDNPGVIKSDKKFSLVKLP